MMLALQQHGTFQHKIHKLNNKRSACQHCNRGSSMYTIDVNCMHMHVETVDMLAQATALSFLTCSPFPEQACTTDQLAAI